MRAPAYRMRPSGLNRGPLQLSPLSGVPSPVKRLGSPPTIALTATATDDDGNVVGANDPAAQTDYIIQKIERALLAAGLKRK
jgi:hypothetical protein